MELEKEKKDPKEAKSNGKMKSAASIPDNYVSILQLQERWMKDKERKQKEREIVQRGVKQQVNAVEEPRVKLEEMGLGAEKEGIEVSANEDGGDSRKKKWSKKKVNKKNQGGPVEAVVKCGSNNNPVKEETQGEKVVQNRENAACNSIGVETQFKQRVEEGGRDRNVNGAVRLNSGKGYYRNQKHDWSSTRVIKATKTMVWVKKGGE
ncbi:uncharacterized protein LOC103843554 [Brassica rapa]|uniref:Uncharacterized protein n=1 Tax=Brassica campestris TaxID=3711 RepID=A0A3P5Y9T0_BRACM|nr:uncharacterized protein LOC103843554 [Brassica rapa]CAG7867498.1 unnamed protein product [Brassica rapa]VDC64422.1 unnamed protein product [Brassica rapa]